MQMVPQYYFSNLPPSESKEILEKVLVCRTNIATPEGPPENQGKAAEEEETSSASEQRCLIQ